MSKHARQRIAERYGIEPSGAEMHNAALSCRKRAATFVRTHQPGQIGECEEWIVLIQSKPVRIIYSRPTNAILTALPPTGIKKRRQSWTKQQRRKQRRRFRHPVTQMSP